MFEAHKKYGHLKWEDLVQPAIDLAHSGFKVTKHLANDLNRTAAEFRKLNPGKNSLLKDSQWQEGDLLVQEDLAKTYRDFETNYAQYTNS